jgi:L-lactate utilization protein LutB
MMIQELLYTLDIGDDDAEEEELFNFLIGNCTSVCPVDTETADAVEEFLKFLQEENEREDQSESKEDEHKGQIYNPISETWSWY